MTTDTREIARSRHRTTRASVIQRILLGALLGGCITLIGYGTFEYTVWHLLPVTRYTLVTDSSPTSGFSLPYVNNTNAQSATALRAQINNSPKVPAGAAPDPLGGAKCMETLNGGPPYSGPISSFRYDFYWHNTLIETVWSQYTACGVGWIQTGGRTVEVEMLSILNSMT